MNINQSSSFLEKVVFDSKLQIMNSIIINNTDFNMLNDITLNDVNAVRVNKNGIQMNNHSLAWSHIPHSLVVYRQGK